MADEIEKYRIPLFDGTNFDNWKFRIETLLNEMDLLDLLEISYTDMVKLEQGDTAQQRREKGAKIQANKKRDRKCKSHIIRRIADSHLEYAKDKKTAFELWTALRQTFERRDIASQLSIHKSLLTMRFDAKNNALANHFLKFDKLIRDLQSTVVLI